MFKRVYANYIKRAIDFFLAIFGIFILSPIFIILTIVLWFDFKSSPFFLQERPGKNEKIFKIIKFKSMNNKKDAQGELLSNRERTTKLGRFIRKYSLDEIPQLFNVVKGDISLIGPRPLVVSYLPYYNENEKKRHAVRPGVTGLAQVKGRNNLVWEDRFTLDVKYVTDMSLFLDIKIMFWTLLKLFSKSEVAVDQDEFLDPFNIYREKQWAENKVG